MPGTAWRPPHTRAIHDGHVVVTSYGCAAGGLAACVTAVGLAEWSQLTKLLLDGPPPQCAS